MLEYPLSIIEFSVYIISLILLLVGLSTRKRYIISWSFSLILINIVLYAKTYTVSSYVSLTLLLLSSTSILAMVFVGVITYMFDHGIVKKY